MMMIVYRGTRTSLHSLICWLVAGLLPVPHTGFVIKGEGELSSSSDKMNSPTSQSQLPARSAAAPVYCYKGPES